MDRVYDDTDALWKRMLKKSDMSHFDTLTSCFGGVAFIENIDEI